MIAKIAFAGIMLAMGAAALAGPASAKIFEHVPVKEVVTACDKNPSCGYSVGDNGVLSGCAVNSGTCFNCKGRECTVSAPLRAGHGGPLGLAGTKLTLIDPSTSPLGGKGSTGLGGGGFGSGPSGSLAGSKVSLSSTLK